MALPLTPALGHACTFDQLELFEHLELALNPIASEFTSVSKHSNFENRTESAESRAPERNEPFGEEGADSAD